jgi:hypothetical protein
MKNGSKCMVAKKEWLERRKHRRFQARPGLLAVLRPAYVSGQVIDISRGGLSFSCVGKHSRINGCLLEVFLVRSHIYLARVPIKTVSCIEIDKEFFRNFITLRRYSVEFINLDAEQTHLLDHIIWKHTLGEV